MTRRLISILALLIVVCMSAVERAAAQNTRRSLVEQARAEFNDTASIRLLLAAQDLALGVPDSLWAVAGYDIAATLIRTQQRPLATVWLRWVIRHGSAWPIDRVAYPPSVISAYDEARAAVTPDPTDDNRIQTSWTWPRTLEPSSSGTVEARDTVNRVPVRLAVIGREGADAPLVLGSGTYELQLTADGFEPRRVTREVLPGVTTALHLELIPVLTPEVQASIDGALLLVSYRLDDRTVCSTGFVASSDGLILTSYEAARSGNRVEVSALNGVDRVANVAVAATDPDNNLAVLRLSRAQTPMLLPAQNVRNNQYAWSAHAADCGAPSYTRSRLVESVSASGPLRLGADLPLAARGGPLVDRTGRLIGVVTGANAALPMSSAQSILERARTAPQIITAAPRKRFPWVWASAGAAAIGLGVALLGGGDGGPPPTTGGLVITFPN